MPSLTNMRLQYPYIINWQTEIVARIALLKDGQSVDNENIMIMARDKGLMPIFAELAASTNIPDVIRETSFDAIDWHIKAFWNPHSNKVYSELVSYDDPSRMETVRLIIKGLSDPDEDLRLRCGNTTTLMLEASVGDNYIVELLFRQMMVGKLQADAVHIISEVIFDFLAFAPTEEKLLPFFPFLMQLRYHILKSHGGLNDGSSASPLTCARMVRIFKTCLEAAVKIKYPSAVAIAVKAILPSWFDVYEAHLSHRAVGMIDQLHGWDVLYLTQQVFESLPALVDTPFMPESMLQTLLSCTLRLLQALYSTFHDIYLSESDGPPENTDHPEEPAHLPEIMYPMFGFISSAIRSQRVMEWFSKDNTKALVEMVLLWSQVMYEDEADFLTRPELFANLTNEHEDICLRVCTFDILTALLKIEPTMSIAAPAIIDASNHMLKTWSKDKGWKPLESSLAVLDSQAKFFTGRFGRECYHVESLLRYFQIAPVHTLNDAPYLQGRFLLFAGQYTSILPSNIFDAYLDAAVDLLRNGTVVKPVRFSALKMLKQFFTAASYPAVLVRNVFAAEEAVRVWARPHSTASSTDKIARSALKAMQSFQSMHAGDLSHRL